MSENTALRSRNAGQERLGVVMAVDQNRFEGVGTESPQFVSLAPFQGRRTVNRVHQTLSSAGINGVIAIKQIIQATGHQKLSYISLEKWRAA